MSDEKEEPKLIIDEDYKTQVEREKEQLRAQQEAEDATESSDAVASEASSSSEAQPDVPPPPPPSLTFLVTSLATQAMAAMGQIPGEDGEPLPVNMDYAKHFIDLIGVLEEKTSGNLDDTESKFLQETLHQMRMMFVSMQQQSKK